MGKGTNEPTLMDKNVKIGKRILSISLAAASLLASASSAFAKVSPAPAQAKVAIETSVAGTQRAVPSPLVLKPASSLQQLAMQHGSHASHTSHHSHHSHHSHTSGR